MNNLLTIKEAAEICSVSSWTIGKAIDEGRLNVVNISPSKKGRRIDPSDLQEFINQCRSIKQSMVIRSTLDQESITSSLDELLKTKRKRAKSN